MTEGALPVNTFDIVWKRVAYNSSFMDLDIMFICALWILYSIECDAGTVSG